jgi:hypothetical protein
MRAKVLAGGSLVLTLGGGFVEKAGLKVVTSGARYLFKDVKLLTTVAGHSPELSHTLEKVWKLNKPQVRAYEKYAKDFGEGYKTEILHLPNGGKGFVTMKSPELSKGHPNPIIWEQYVDAAGEKIFMGKRTFHVEDGSFKHFHQQFPITSKGPKHDYAESEYWQHLKDTFKGLSPRKGK